MTNTQFDQKQEIIEGNIHAVIHAVKSADFPKELTELVTTEGTKAINASRKMRQEVYDQFGIKQEFKSYDAEENPHTFSLHLTAEEILDYAKAKLDTITFAVIHPSDNIINESTYDRLEYKDSFAKADKDLFDSTKAMSEALRSYQPQAAVAPKEEAPAPAKQVENPKEIEKEKEPTEPTEQAENTKAVQSTEKSEEEPAPASPEQDQK